MSDSYSNQYLYCFHDRTRFIRRFHDEARATFVQTRRKIEAGEEPYVPPYSENWEEPPFFAEWTDAVEMAEVVDQVCVSMLSSALQLFLNGQRERIKDRPGALEWIKDRNKTRRKKKSKKRRRAGFWDEQQDYYLEILLIDWSGCPADLDLLEEVVFLRQKAQHPEGLLTTRLAITPSDLNRKQLPFFVNKEEIEAVRERLGGDYGNRLVFPWYYEVTAEKLDQALSQADAFCEWLEDQVWRWRAT